MAVSIRHSVCLRYLTFQYRYLNFWSWRSIVPSFTKDEGRVEERPKSNEELLQDIAHSHLGCGVGNSWRTAGLGDTNTKGKILCSYESTFSLSIPDHNLGTITTFGDLLELLENYQPPEEAPNVYPLFRDDDLPPNLDVEFISTAPIPRKTRKPFDNVGIVRAKVKGKKKGAFIHKHKELGRGKTRGNEEYESGW